MSSPPNVPETRTDLLDRAVAVLRAQGLVAFPTETVYGLGADARDPVAVARVFAAKGRPPDHPLIVHLAHARQMTSWAATIPAAAWALAEAYWPGPITLILPRHPSVPLAVTGGMDTVALRVPGHPMALELLDRFGGGIAAPSANRYGRVSPTTAEHVRQELGSKVDLVLDGGACQVGIESTIVDVSAAGSVRILRPGVIGRSQLRAVVGRALAAGGDESIRCPGRKASHYAPSAKVVLATDGDDAALKIEAFERQGLRVGFLAAAPLGGRSSGTVWLDFPDNPIEQARLLYDRLRKADGLDLQVLVVIPPTERGVGRAIVDRLLRAAGRGDDMD